MGTISRLCFAIIVGLSTATAQTTAPSASLPLNAAGAPAPRSAEYAHVQQRLQRGWNTWDTSTIAKEARPKVVAVDASGVLDMEYTALKMFAHIAEKQSENRTQLWLIGMNPRVLVIVKRSPLAKILRREGMHSNLEMALEHYLSTSNTRRSAPLKPLRRSETETPEF